MAADGPDPGPGRGAAVLGWPAAGPAGAVEPIAVLAPGPPGGEPPGTGLPFGFKAPGATAALGGAGGAPRAPGTGSALGLCNVWFGEAGFCGRPAGAFAWIGALGRPGWPGVPGMPGLTAGLIDALGGTGALPCWIRLARCATAGGSVGVALPACPGTTGAPIRPPGLPPGPTTGAPPCGAPPSGRRLMTLAMAERLWMLAKMMLFGGGAT